VHTLVSVMLMLEKLHLFVFTSELFVTCGTISCVLIDLLKHLIFQVVNVIHIVIVRLCIVCSVCTLLTQYCT